MRKWIVTGDILRGPATATNDVSYVIRWLAAAIAPGAEAAGAEITVVSPDSGGGVFPVADFLTAAGFSVDRDGWAGIQARDALTTAATTLLATYFPAGTDLVVGWGLPPFLVRHLARARIPFLSIEFDTIRFRSDLGLVVETLDPRIAASLEQIALDRDDEARDVALFRARYAMFPPLAWLSQDANVAVWVGQTPVDLALVADGVLVTPLAVAVEIRSATADNDLLIVAPHPSAVDPLLLSAARHIPNAVPLALPTYDLIGHPATRHFIGVSSSALDEARVLGKRATQLRVSDVARAAAAWPGHRRTRVGTALFHPALWRHVTDGVALPIDLAGRPGLSLRHALAQFFGLATAGQGAGPIRIARGATVSFAAGAMATAPGLGWHAPEAWGVWSSADLATLLVALEHVPGEGEHLDIDLITGWGEHRAQVDVTITGVGRPSQRTSQSIPAAAGRTTVRLNITAGNRLIPLRIEATPVLSIAPGGVPVSFGIGLVAIRHGA